ncbi:MAG: nucleoside recognition domain-containing protein [Pseudomonadota bacterium]
MTLLPTTKTAKEYSQKLGRKVLSTFWELVKIMVPVMIAVRVADQLGLTDWLGLALGPVMAWIGLPAEAGLVWGITLLIGVYGGLGAYFILLPDIDISVAQHSILCTMMLMAHFIPVEQAMVARAGAGFWITSAVRVGTALLFALILGAITQATGWLGDPLILAWTPDIGADTGWVDWAMGIGWSLATILVIFFALFIALDILERLGVIGLFSRALEPVLRVIGIDRRLAPMSTVGLLLGLIYCTGMMIQASREHDFSPRAKLLALSLISFCHGLVEGTLLFLALGADIWIVLVARLIFTFAFMAIMAKLVSHWPTPKMRPA